MKIEVLKEFIKKTVQQEVRNVLKTELKSQLSEIFANNSSKPQKKTKSADSDLEAKILNELESMNESVAEVETKPTKKYVKYTNNPILNDILNQTTGGVPQEGGMVSMMGGYGSTSSQVITETKAPENAPEPVKSVYSAMTRDYSKLMSAIEKKKSKI
jgi:hypothetical protein